MSLAGIFARGSARSRAISERLRVPLFTNLDEIPNDVSIACVAVGNDAQSIASQLLRRGIRVLIEHPVAPRELSALQAEAALCQTYIAVNYHYSDLEAPQIFIKRFRDRRAVLGDPIFISCAGNLRTVHSLVDILASSDLPMDLRDVRAIRAASGKPLHFLSGEFGTIPFGMTLATGSERDDGRSNGFSHEISAAFESSKLSLSGTWGPVLSEMAVDSSTDAPIWRVEGALSPPSPRAFSAMRAAANILAIKRLRDMALSGQAAQEYALRQLQVASSSYELLRSLGSAS